MKLIKIVGLCLVITLVGCQNQIGTDVNHDRMVSEKSKVDRDISQVNEMIDLSEEDFYIRNQKKTIYLEMPYEDFEANHKEDEIEWNLVTSMLAGENECKIYRHLYEGVEILTSNEKAVLKGEEINRYYITEIKLRTSEYKTQRGIKIGDSLEEVEKVYGKGKEVEVDDFKAYEYTFGKKTIHIQFNSHQQVESIRLYLQQILPEEEKQQGDNPLEDNRDKNEVVGQEEQEEQGEQYIHSTLEFSMQIPSSWKGKYIINETEVGVEFLHNTDLEIQTSLFTIMIWGSEEEWDLLSEEEKSFPYQEVGRKNGLVYVKSGPGDIPYDADYAIEKKYAAEYEQMIKEIQDIVDSFVWIDSDAINKEKIIYKNSEAGFELELPRSWEGKYTIDEWDEGTEFIHLINGKKGDRLFTISIFGTHEEWQVSGDYPYGYIGENKDKVYVITIPSESRYDYDTETGQAYIKDYQSLWEDIQLICDGIKFMN